MQWIKIISLSLVLTFTGLNANAALIDIYLEQGSTTSQKIEFNSFLEIMELVSNGGDFSNIGDKFSGYTFSADDAASLVINYRGVPIVLETEGTGGLTGAKLSIGGKVYAEASGTGIDAVFEALAKEITGDANFDSNNIDFAKISEFLALINEIAVKQTPFDPIAGNPSSFLYRSQDASYNSMMYDYQFRPHYTRHYMEDARGRKGTVQSITVPLGFQINFTDKTRLSFNTLLSAQDYDGSLAGDLSFGTTLMVGVFDNNMFDVRVGGGLRAGVAGSLDFATVAPMWNAHGGVMTRYQTPIKELELVMLNNFGYYAIPQIDIQSIAPDLNLSIPYTLSAIGAKNGITANYYFNPTFYGTVSFIDTRFFRYEQYIGFYEELRLGIEYARDSKFFIDRLSFFTAFKLGEKSYKGLEAGFGLSF